MSNIERKADVEEYLRSGGATDLQIQDFFDFCEHFHGQGKVGRNEVCRLWARCLRHRRTPYRKHGHFDFHSALKWYMRSISEGDIVDADPPEDAIFVSPENFVKYVVHHLDESF